MVRCVAQWTTCLSGQGHLKAKPHIFQGARRQQEKTDLLKLDFSSFVTNHNCDFLCHGPPTERGADCTVVHRSPAYGKGQGKNPEWYVGGCEGDKRLPNATLLTQKLQPPPWTKQLLYWSQFFLFLETQMPRNCVLHIPTVNDLL